MSSTDYFHYDPANGTITGVGFTPDGTIPVDCVACTDAEAANPSAYQVDVSTKPPSVIAASTAQLAAQAAADLKAAALSALVETDSVYIRCGKAGVAFPAGWQTYTTKLRAIANGTDTTSTSLPTKPSYPSGT